MAFRQHMHFAKQPLDTVGSNKRERLVWWDGGALFNSHQK